MVEIEKNKLKDVKDGCVGCLILIIIIAVIFFFVKDNNTQTPEQRERSKMREQAIKARTTLDQAIKANLRDPGSYQHIRTEDWETLGDIYVKIEFRGKNAFGGYDVCTFVAQFNFKTKPIEWGITNNPSSDRGCRAIMIALP